MTQAPYVPVSKRADDLFAQYQHDLHRRTDRMFAWLMGAQWIGGIIFALLVSPLAWSGAESRVHLHVWAAVLLGGAICLFPALLGLLRPGLPSTRYIIGVAQMLMGALLIHLTGGRIETHFHVFGSLAFLAFYRDWRVLVPATIVVALDHMLRGLFWPQSVYGVVVASQWRWIEHAAWVAFEDVFLVISCTRGIAEMRQTAERTAALEQEIRTREQTEAELRITQRQAEAATRAKSNFLASMSHELRTPLNAIILYSELLQEQADEEGRAAASADLVRIQSAGNHLLTLINGILDLSKIEAGKMDLSLEVFDVRDLLDGVLDTITPLAQKNGTTVSVRYGDGIGAMHADTMKTRQILLNLLSNAAKFTKQGAITIDVRRASLDGRPAVEFAVADTGIGMTAEQLGRIFQPFTQADVTTTRTYGGTGLGLAIVWRFCQLMGGRIIVDSRPGAGSRFTACLPLQVVDAIEEAATADAA